jgi:hypothetical protein
MKQSMGEKSIAWFRLAECISRGEKERALNLYRLLTHSFHDPAFIKKLEADIIATFDLLLATKEYIQAAALYYKRGDAQEALLIYQLVTELLVQQKELVYIETVLEQLQEQVTPAEYAGITHGVVCKLLLSKLYQQQSMKKYIEHTVLAYTTYTLDRELQQFLVQLQQLDATWYSYALDYLERSAVLGFK